MATETEKTEPNWTQQQLEVAGQLANNAKSALLTDGGQDIARALLYETRAVLDMVEDQELDAVLELRAQLCNDLGFLFQRTGDLAQARDYHQQAVEYCEKLLERGVAFRPNTTATLINFAGTLVNTEDLEGAYKYILRATELIKDYLDENPDDLESNHLGFGAFHTRALIEIASKKGDEAHESAEIARAYAEKAYKDNLNNSLQTANSFQQLAIQFFQAEDLDHAIYWGKKSEEVARIAFEIEKEPAVPVFVQTQLFLILFHETKGTYSEAEDALYNAIDVIGNHPQLLERGRQFYQQCRKQTDKRLEEGGLPREEVEEGVKEIETRIEAFGGPEVLERYLRNLAGENPTA